MNKKECLKIFIRGTAFLCIFVMLFGYATNLLMRHDDESNEVHAFYSEPKDTIDVLYVGSSPLLRGVSPMVMWQEHGFTGYVRASALQAPAVSYGLLAESLEYQNPKAVVLLCDNIFSHYDYVEREGDLRRGLDGMKLSQYKWDIIREVTAADERQTLLAYVFPLLRYHDRWKDINLAEDKPEPLLEHSFKKGNVYLRESAPQSYPEGFMQPTGAEAPEFNISAKGYVERSIQLCKEKGIPVVLLHLPKMSWSYEHSRALENFALENGAYYLDLDRTEHREILQLDAQVDYYDQGHMNLTGLVKVSAYLGDWLDTCFDLPDHRNDPAISESWNQDLAEYMERTGISQ